MLLLNYLKSLIFAASLASFTSAQALSPYIASLAAGLGLAKIGSTQTLSLTSSPTIENTYVKNSKWYVFFSPQLSIAKNCFKNFNSQFQFGLRLTYINQLKTSGEVYLFTLPEFNNLNYHYDVQSLNLMVTAKILMFNTKKYHPYFEIALGLANNRAKNYAETARVSTAIANPPFANHSQDYFAYSLGFGVDRVMNKHISVGIGYQFSDLGGAKLGVSSAQTSSQVITLKHLYIQQLLISLNYQL